MFVATWGPDSIVTTVVFRAPIGFQQHLMNEAPTIRQGSSILCRRTACHAREDRTLEEHLELLQLHYNFIRPHSALRFGAEVRTPAMQAGLAVRKLSFRDVFMMRAFFFLCVLAVLMGWIRDFIFRGVDLGSSRHLVFRPNNT